MSSQVLGEKHDIEAKPSQDGLQKRPNRPKMEDPSQNSRTKKKHKTQRLRSEGAKPARRHHGKPVVFTTGRGGCHASSWWLPRPWCPLFPFRLFCFPSWLFVSYANLCCVLSLKRRMYLAWKEGRIHSLNTLSHSLKLRWRNWKNRRQGQAKATVFGCEVKDH